MPENKGHLNINENTHMAFAQFWTKLPLFGKQFVTLHTSTLGRLTLLSFISAARFPSEIKTTITYSIAYLPQYFN